MYYVNVCIYTSNYLRFAAFLMIPHMHSHTRACVTSEAPACEYHFNIVCRNVYAHTLSLPLGKSL